MLTSSEYDNTHYKQCIWSICKRPDLEYNPYVCVIVSLSRILVTCGGVDDGTPQSTRRRPTFLNLITNSTLEDQQHTGHLQFGLPTLQISEPLVC